MLFLYRTLAVPVVFVVMGQKIISRCPFHVQPLFLKLIPLKCDTKISAPFAFTNVIMCCVCEIKWLLNCKRKMFRSLNFKCVHLEFML